MKAAGKEALAISLYWQNGPGECWFCDMVIGHKSNGDPVKACFSGSADPWWTRRLARNQFGDAIAVALIRNALEDYRMTAPEYMIVKAAHGRTGGDLIGAQANAPRC